MGARNVHCYYHYYYHYYYYYHVTVYGQSPVTLTPTINEKVKWFTPTPILKQNHSGGDSVTSGVSLTPQPQPQTQISNRLRAFSADLVVAFFSRVRILGECSTIHSPPTLKKKKKKNIGD